MPTIYEHVYTEHKQWCDDYFYLKGVDEQRGVLVYSTIQTNGILKPTLKYSGRWKWLFRSNLAYF